MSYHDSSYSRLGEKLKKARRELGMTQAVLAHGIVTRNMLSRIENGEALPSIPTLTALAERLGLPAGFFLSDANDGSDERTKRLLEWIDHEYRTGSFEEALRYAECLDDYVEEKQSLLSRCRYAVAVDQIRNGRLRTAYAELSAILKEAKALTFSEKNEGKLLRALLNGFLAQPESGREEETFLSLYRFADASADLVTFSTVLNVLRAADLSVAEAVHRFSVYTDRSYALLIEGVFFFERGMHADAKKRFLESMGFSLLPPLQAYALTMLEACSAAMGDYENAYAYMERRRESVTRWISS